MESEEFVEVKDELERHVEMGISQTVLCNKCNTICFILYGEPKHCKNCFEKWLTETFQVIDYPSMETMK